MDRSKWFLRQITKIWECGRDNLNDGSLDLYMYYACIDRKVVDMVDYNFTRKLKELDGNSFASKEAFIATVTSSILEKICTDLDGKLESQLVAHRIYEKFSYTYRADFDNNTTNSTGELARTSKATIRAPSFIEKHSEKVTVMIFLSSFVILLAVLIYVWKAKRPGRKHSFKVPIMELKKSKDIENADIK